MLHFLRGHHHHHVPSYNRVFAVCMLLNGGYFVLQVTVALYLANSVALLTDAFHNLSDVAALGIMWLANVLLATPPNSRRTYGFKAVSIFVSGISSVVLLGVTVWAGLESIMRLRNPGEVSGHAIGWTASVGIAINLASAILLYGGGKKDLNIRSAFVHQAGDAIQSVGVVVAGVAIARQGWQVIDPIVGIVISVIIVAMTVGIFRDSILLAIQGVPSGIQVQQIADFLRGVPGVVEVHDLHVMGVSTAETSLTAHLVLSPQIVDLDGLLGEIRHTLATAHKIHRTTLQPERHGYGQPCYHAGHLFGRVDVPAEPHCEDGHVH